SDRLTVHGELQIARISVDGDMTRYCLGHHIFTALSGLSRTPLMQPTVTATSLASTTRREEPEPSPAMARLHTDHWEGTRYGIEPAGIHAAGADGRLRRPRDPRRRGSLRRYAPAAAGLRLGQTHSCPTRQRPLRERAGARHTRARAAPYHGRR